MAAHRIFANVTLITKVEGIEKILLALSEDRVDRNIWTPPGGEVKVREGQMPREAAVAEVYEEVGLRLDSTQLILIDEPQFIYPTAEYDPYNGIGLIILSYVYAGVWKPKDIKLNVVPEKGCNIVAYRMVPYPWSKEEIEKWDIKIYPNYAEKLLKAYEFF